MDSGSFRFCSTDRPLETSPERDARRGVVPSARRNGGIRLAKQRNRGPLVVAAILPDPIPFEIPGAAQTLLVSPVAPQARGSGADIPAYVKY